MIPAYHANLLPNAHSTAIPFIPRHLLAAMLNPSEKITILLSVSLAVRGNADFHLATIEHDEITEGFDSNTSNWYAHQNSSTPFVVQTTSGVINISTANQNVSPTGEVDENGRILYTYCNTW